MTTLINVIVNADSKSINYGDSLPQLTYSITFSDGNDHMSDIIIGSNSILLENSTVYNVGTYQIILKQEQFTVNINSINSYVFQFNDSVMTVNQRPIIITSSDKSMNYNGSHFSGNLSYITNNNFAQGDSLNNFNGSIIYSGTYNNAVNAGTYTISISTSTLSNPNYLVTYIDGTLTIYKVPLTVTANTISSTYTGTAYTNFSVGYIGFVGTDNALSSLTGILDYNTIQNGNNVIPINTGSYTIIPSGLTGHNYTISYINGILNINKALLTVNKSSYSNSNPLTFTYGSAIDYTQFYGFTGFVNGETKSVVSGIATVYINGITGLTGIPYYSVGTYTNINIHDIGTLSSTNYLFTLNSASNTNNTIYLNISKAPLTIYPILPTSSYIYGTNRINYTDLYGLTGFVNGDSSSVITKDNNTHYPTINFISSNSVSNQFRYNSSRFDVGTYNIQIGSIGGLLANNYSFIVSNPSTLPTIIITPSTITISINSSYKPYYGDQNIQISLFNNTLNMSGFQYGQSRNNISTGTVNFKLTSTGVSVSYNILPSTIPYNVTVDISNYASNAPNYIFSFLSNISTYNMTVQKALLTLYPISGSTYNKNYGITFSDSEISSLYGISGFVDSDGNQSTVCTGTPTLGIRNSGSGVTYSCNNVNPYIPMPVGSYTLSVIGQGTLLVNSNSNYSNSIQFNNSIQRAVSINKISLASQSISLVWNSYIPPIPYGVPLTVNQLNASVPFNPNTNSPIGYITYKGINITTSIVDSTNFIVGGTPSIGTYQLTAYLNVTDPNYNIPSPQVYAVNTSYNITILPNYSLIGHFNPLSVQKGSSLTSTQLNATCNSSTNPSADISYYDQNGNQINVGIVINQDMTVIDVLNNHSNTNYFPKYTFRQVNFTTK